MNLKMRVSIQNGARPLANFEGWNWWQLLHLVLNLRAGVVVKILLAATAAHYVVGRRAVVPGNNINFSKIKYNLKNIYMNNQSLLITK